MTTPLSDERLAKIRAREQAATPGPWAYTLWDDAYFMTTFGVRADGRVVAYAEHDRGPDCADADMEFTAAARQDVPDLLAEVTRLRARVARLEGVLREVEWIEPEPTPRAEPYCLWCEAVCDNHAPDCALDAALRDAQ